MIVTDHTLSAIASQAEIDGHQATASALRELELSRKEIERLRAENEQLNGVVARDVVATQNLRAEVAALRVQHAAAMHCAGEMKAACERADKAEDEKHWAHEEAHEQERLRESIESERDQLRAQLAAMELAARALTDFMLGQAAPVFSPKQLRDARLGAAAHRLEALLLMGEDLRAAMEKKP